MAAVISPGQFRVKFPARPADKNSRAPETARSQQPLGEKIMTAQEAIRILMQSPFYFKLDVAARRTLIREFCTLLNDGLDGKGSGES